VEVLLGAHGGGGEEGATRLAEPGRYRAEAGPLRSEKAGREEGAACFSGLGASGARTKDGEMEQRGNEPHGPNPEREMEEAELLFRDPCQLEAMAENRFVKVALTQAPHVLGVAAAALESGDRLPVHHSPGGATEARQDDEQSECSASNEAGHRQKG